MGFFAGNSGETFWKKKLRADRNIYTYLWNEILSLKNYCCGTSGRGRSVSVRYAKQTNIFFGYATDPLSTDFVSQTAVNKLITRHRNSHSLLPSYYYHSMNLHVFRAEIHTPRW